MLKVSRNRSRTDVPAIFPVALLALVRKFASSRITLTASFISSTRIWFPGEKSFSAHRPEWCCSTGTNGNPGIGNQISTAFNPNGTIQDWQRHPLGTHDSVKTGCLTFLPQEESRTRLGFHPHSGSIFPVKGRNPQEELDLLRLRFRSLLVYQAKVEQLCHPQQAGHGQHFPRSLPHFSPGDPQSNHRHPPGQRA